MFLSDQQKANKADGVDIKLLDLATNALKEWDQIMSIQDEYTAKFLQESEKIQSEVISNPQVSFSAQPEIKFAFDAQGTVSVFNEIWLRFLNSPYHQKDLYQHFSFSRGNALIKSREKIQL